MHHNLDDQTAAGGTYCTGGSSIEEPPGEEHLGYLGPGSGPSSEIPRPFENAQKAFILKDVNTNGGDV